jgi:predicted DNA-binding protein
MATKKLPVREDARNAPRGRPRTREIPMRSFSSRLREDYDERLTELTRLTGKPKTRLLEEAFELYLDSCERLSRIAAKTGQTSRRVLADALKRYEEDSSS